MANLVCHYSLALMSLVRISLPGVEFFISQMTPPVESANYSVVRHNNSTRVDEGRKCWILLAITIKGTHRSGEGGEESAMWPWIWVTTKRKKVKKVGDNKWDGQKTHTHISLSLSSVPFRIKLDQCLNWLSKSIYFMKIDRARTYYFVPGSVFFSSVGMLC